MSKRQRMTWAADKAAANPPAIPGYDVEDQDHPAKNQPDPDAHQYENGDTSAWAEDPTPPPYGDSGAPALPGYGVEDQDHPAHKGQVGRQANLGELVRRKSAKCLVLARNMLGKQASQQAVEDQALDLMDLSDSAIEAAFGRSADFMAGDMEALDEPVEAEDGCNACGDFMAVEEKDDSEAAGNMAARLSALENELAAMRRASRKANQNDPKGPTLGASGKSEEQEKSEEAAANKNAALKPVLAMFDAYDRDRDGFITASEWKGPRSLFASLDTDRDGIIARYDIVKSASEEEAEDEEIEEKTEAKKGGKKAKKAEGDEKKGGKKADDDEDEDEGDEGEGDEGDEGEGDEGDEGEGEGDEEKDEKEAGKKGGKKAKKAGDVPEAFKKNWDKGDGEKKDEGGEKKDEEKKDEGDEKKGGKKSARALAGSAPFGHTAEFDDDEIEMLNAMQFGQDQEIEAEADDLVLDPNDLPAEVEDELTDPTQDYAGYFAADAIDPMGLDDGSGMTAEDEAAFDEIFGKKASEDEGEGEEEEEKEAKKKANFKPQPRKPQAGPRTLGTMSRTASSRANEIDELSKLWTSAPDVKGAFGQ